MPDNEKDPRDVLSVQPAHYRRMYFLPEWLPDEQVHILICHYLVDIDKLGHRYKVQPYALAESFCIVDLHTDELFHTQRGPKTTRRIWTSPRLSEAINYAEFLSKEDRKPKDETHISQVIAHVNQRLAAKKRQFAEPETPTFKLCEKCQNMVKGNHVC